MARGNVDDIEVGSCSLDAGRAGELREREESGTKNLRGKKEANRGEKELRTRRQAFVGEPSSWISWNAWE